MYFMAPGDSKDHRRLQITVLNCAHLLKVINLCVGYNKAAKWSLGGRIWIIGRKDDQRCISEHFPSLDK